MKARILRAGAHTTVQDRGRRGRQRDGVPVSGPMDDVALRIANWLVGNADDAAVLEATLAGPALRLDDDALVAITGADMDARVDERRIRPWHVVHLLAGQTLALDGARRGCRAYVAIAGGFDVPCVLDSRATFTRARLGGQHGRVLERGDVLPVGVTPWRARARAPRGVDSRSLDLERRVVRFVPGPHWEALTPASQRALTESCFTLSSESDRMGLRFTGATLELGVPTEVISAGVTTGTIQLPPGGAPIVLMADHQTIGGYPRIGEVATIDHPVLAQLRPGEAIRFEETTLEAAQRAFLRRERELACLHRSLLTSA